MFLSQTLAHIPDPLARWCRASVCDDCEQHVSAVSSSRAWQPTRTLQGLYSWYAVSIKAPLRPRVVAVGSIKYRILSKPFFPRDGSLRVPAIRLIPYQRMVAVTSYNSKHTHLFACISRQPPVHLMERVRSAESHPRLPIKIVRQARMRPLGSPLDPSPSPPSLSCPYSLRHCLYLLPHRAILYSLYSHTEHPVSEYIASCEKRASSHPVTFDFSVLFLSSYHRLDRFIVISPFTIPKWPFLNSKVFESITHIRDSTWYLSINSELTVAECMCMPHGR
jgi:hypothetical protein